MTNAVACETAGSKQYYLFYIGYTLIITDLYEFIAFRAISMFSS